MCVAIYIYIYIYTCVCVCVCVRAGAVDNKNNLLTIVNASKESKRQQYVLFMYFHRFYSKYFVLR